MKNLKNFPKFAARVGLFNACFVVAFEYLTFGHFQIEDNGFFRSYSAMDV